MKVHGLLFVIVILGFPLTGLAAYHHMGETDSDTVLEVYPAIKDSKLDSCALCHTGGSYEKKPGKWIEMGSCQWCHYSYGYDETGNIEDTLNSYGKDYNDYGRDSAALQTIASHDSDGDGFVNSEEIALLRYPGNEADDPSKVPAPFMVLDRSDLEKIRSHSQFQLMNTHKSGDFYAEYQGVTMKRLLRKAKVLDSADGITVFAPDGWAQYHPLEPLDDPLMYHAIGEYPQAQFHYIPEADVALSDYGWCTYPDFSYGLYENGEEISVDGGLQMILAYKRNGSYLEDGTLDDDNRLDGEGPFRVVPPQKVPGPPDQSSKAQNQNVPWPFDETADHNAGFASRSATIIRVEPLPAGTTDIDTMEAGWEYIDQKKIVIFGAIDPIRTVRLKLSDLRKSIRSLDRGDFWHPRLKKLLLKKIHIVNWLVKKDRTDYADWMLSRLLTVTDGCAVSGMVDENDWIRECDQQNGPYWAIREIQVLLSVGN